MAPRRLAYSALLTAISDLARPFPYHMPRLCPFLTSYFAPSSSRQSLGVVFGQLLRGLSTCISLDFRKRYGPPRLSSLACFDQGLKKPLRQGVVGGQFLWVPLDADGEGVIFHLDGLYNLIWGTGSDD
jgi:hypothetical protein